MFGRYCRKSTLVCDKRGRLAPSLEVKMNKLENTQIELRHIQLELENGRFQHFRSFVDQYYCYKHGYINRNGKAKWSDLFWKEIVSKNAQKTNDKKKVIKEHVIPLRVITDKLAQLAKDGTPSIPAIQEVLDKYTIFATITKDEDQRLRDAKLNSKMPNAFYDEKDPLYDDPFARYKAVNIKYEKLKENL